MTPSGVGFVGFRTERFDEMVALFRDVIGLSIIRETPGAAWFQLGAEAELHVCRGGHRPCLLHDRPGGVTRYCAWPTQAASYLTGCLEIVRIRDAFFAGRGASDTDALRAFNDGITSSGGLPISLAERAALRRVTHAS